MAIVDDQYKYELSIEITTQLKVAIYSKTQHLCYFY